MSEENEAVEVLVVGDMHIKHKDLEVCMKLMAQIIEEARIYQPDFLVLLGDIYDDFGKASSQIFERVNEFIEKLSKITKVYIIVGNHDLNHSKANCGDGWSKYHFFGPLKKWKNVKVADEPFIEEIKGKKFVFCPYVSPGKFLPCLDELGDEWKEATAIFGHQDILGYSYELDAEPWPEDAPLLISGHIHEHLHEGNIFYAGSSRQTKSNESPEKFLFSFTFEEGEPHIQTVEVILRGTVIVEHNYEDMASFDWSLVDTHNVHLRIKGTHEQFKLFHRSPLHSKLKAAKVKIGFEPIEIPLEPKVHSLKKKSFEAILAALVEDNPSALKIYKEFYPNYSEPNKTEEEESEEVIFR